MFERSIQWGLCDAAQYTALDSMRENILEARLRLPLWAKKIGYYFDDILKTSSDFMVRE